MLPVILTVISYNQETNTCKAEIDNSALVIDFDPFVGCALQLSDEDYFLGKGSEIVGNKYVMTLYTSYKDNVVPHKGGLQLIKGVL